MANPKDLDATLAHMNAQVEVNGVAAVKVSDGECFYFSLEKLKQVVTDAEARGEKRVFIFVKTGGKILLN